MTYSNPTLQILLIQRSCVLTDSVPSVGNGTVQRSETSSDCPSPLGPAVKSKFPSASGDESSGAGGTALERHGNRELRVHHQQRHDGRSVSLVLMTFVQLLFYGACLLSSAW